MPLSGWLFVRSKRVPLVGETLRWRVVHWLWQALWLRYYLVCPACPRRWRV